MFAAQDVMHKRELLAAVLASSLPQSDESEDYGWPIATVLIAENWVF